MRKTAIALLALGLVVASTAYASNAVRISQVYGGGGGGSTNTYKYDYVELFNNSGAPVNIGGWSLQYGSATGSTFGSSTFNYAVIPTGATIPACGYYLVRCGSMGSGGADLPIAADYNSPTINISATTGKMAIFDGSGLFNQICTYAQANAQDLVGWATANCFETTVGPTTTGAHVLVRGSGGALDTDNNAANITSVLATQPAAQPRNSSSPRNPDCAVVIGACCLPPLPVGGCIIVSLAFCVQQGGTYIGNGTLCVPDPCPATPTKGTTWGQIKTIYK